MTARRRRRLTGLLYVAPAVIFVLIFTGIPLAAMVGMSFTNWSLITPPKFTGLANFQQIAADAQFWGALGYTLKYTLLITPILMVGGYLLALLVALNTPLRRTTRAIIFVPVVIGLGVSSLLWVWLFDPTFGLINQALADLGLIDKPIQFLGVDADTSTWSIIGSVVWKVLGFGMILFVAAIQAIPSEINEATMVDGATFWQRTRRVTVPLTRRTILLGLAALTVILLVALLMRRPAPDRYAEVRAARRLCAVTRRRHEAAAVSSRNPGSRCRAFHPRGIGAHPPATRLDRRSPSGLARLRRRAPGAIASTHTRRESVARVASCRRAADDACRM